MTRHFLDIHRLDAADLRAILDDAHARKRARKGWPQGRPDADAPARDRVLAMIFEKNSTRTRFSFDAAIRQLGGSSIIATAEQIWPVRVRKSTAVPHSSCVSSTSRAKLCRCLTRLAMTVASRGWALAPVRPLTTSTEFSSVK